MRKPLKNKRGFSYVLTCVIILVVMMLVTVAMQYAFVYHVAREQQDDMQLKLDGYVTRYAVSKYDALKQGKPWDDYIDRDDLVEGVYTLLGFPRIRTLAYREPMAVDGKYVMSQPTIVATTGDAFGVLVEYELSIPFVMFNREIADITVSITIVSQYKLK